MNNVTLREELDLVKEIRVGVTLREASLKQKITVRYDTKVVQREFEINILVLKRNHKESREGKLTANWEDLYRIYTKIGTGAYYLINL